IYLDSVDSSVVLLVLTVRYYASTVIRNGEQPADRKFSSNDVKSLRYQDFIKIGALRNASLTDRRHPVFFFFVFTVLFLLDEILFDPFARTCV
ncbi:unnamed protein product, partial [Heterotrigona itama]